MDISSIQSVFGNVPTLTGTEVSTKNTPNVSLFENVLNSVSSMEQTQTEAKVSMADVLAGNSENAHNALIQMQNVELQMSYAASAKDKIVSGFNTLFNMQI